MDDFADDYYGGFIRWDSNGVTIPDTIKGREQRDKVAKFINDVWDYRKEPDRSKRESLATPLLFELNQMRINKLLSFYRDISKDFSNWKLKNSKMTIAS